MRTWCEASLSYRCHRAYLNIVFHDIDSGGESHGSRDRICNGGELYSLRRRIDAHILPVWPVFGDLQLCPCQEGVAADVDCIFGVALRYRVAIFRVKVQGLASLVVPCSGHAEGIVL
jgi:hypothetical protein